MFADQSPHFHRSVTLTRSARSAEPRRVCALPLARVRHDLGRSSFEEKHLIRRVFHVAPVVRTERHVPFRTKRQEGSSIAKIYDPGCCSDWCRGRTCGTPRQDGAKAVAKPQTSAVPGERPCIPPHAVERSAHAALPASRGRGR